MSFLFDGISFGTQEISLGVFHVTITNVNSLFPRFPLNLLFSLTYSDFNFEHYKQNAHFTYHSI